MRRRGEGGGGAAAAGSGLILKFPLAENFCTHFRTGKDHKINALISVQNCYAPTDSQDGAAC
jgi:hypothetical protein